MKQLSYIIRSAIHQVMTHFTFMRKVGKLGGGNLSNLEGTMWL